MQGFFGNVRRLGKKGVGKAKNDFPDFYELKNLKYLKFKYFYQCV